MTEIIEMDESVFGKKQKYSRGRLTKKVWVFGLAQRESRKTRFFVIPNRTNATLHALICDHVEKGICLFHDDWPGYRKLHELGYPHGTVVHKKEFKSKEGVCTNLIEGIWGNLKMRINNQRGIRHYMLQGFLDEWSYRYEVNKDNTVWSEMLGMLNCENTHQWNSSEDLELEYKRFMVMLPTNSNNGSDVDSEGKHDDVPVGKETCVEN